jgi:hypothetical protein
MFHANELIGIEDSDEGEASVSGSCTNHASDDGGDDVETTPSKVPLTEDQLQRCRENRAVALSKRALARASTFPGAENSANSDECIHKKKRKLGESLYGADYGALQAVLTEEQRQRCYDNRAAAETKMSSPLPTVNQQNVASSSSSTPAMNVFQRMMSCASKGGAEPPLPAPQKFRPRAVELEPCSLSDGGARARALLARDGVVVFKSVASSDDLQLAESKFWDWLERTDAGRAAGLRRAAPQTHQSKVWKALGYSNTGVMVGESIGQSEFMWHCRRIPGVAKAFAAIFDVAPTDLVTSFDGAGSWRNYWLHGGKGSGTITDGNWFHLDQAFFEKPGFDTVQGLLNFYPTNEASGSTVMVPGSHLDFEKICAGKPTKGSFVRLVSTADVSYCQERAVMVLLGPGDLCLWDSRTVHCSSGVDPTAAVSVALPGRERAPLARLVAYISMLPRAHLGATDAECAKVAAARRRAVLTGIGSGHDPRRMRVRSEPSRHYTPPGLCDSRFGLV